METQTFRSKTFEQFSEQFTAIIQGQILKLVYFNVTILKNI